MNLYWTYLNGTFASCLYCILVLMAVDMTEHIRLVQRETTTKIRALIFGEQIARICLLKQRNMLVVSIVCALLLDYHNCCHKNSGGRPLQLLQLYFNCSTRDYLPLLLGVGVLLVLVYGENHRIKRWWCFCHIGCHK